MYIPGPLIITHFQFSPCTATEQLRLHLGPSAYVLPAQPCGLGDKCAGYFCKENSQQTTTLLTPKSDSMLFKGFSLRNVESLMPQIYCLRSAKRKGREGAETFLS